MPFFKKERNLENTVYLVFFRKDRVVWTELTCLRIDDSEGALLNMVMNPWVP
jgi:hypothetical protein